MPKQQTDHLFQLIKSLSSSEKRNFRVYVNRIKSSEQTKFLHLFDLLDKQVEYDEQKLLQKAPSIKHQQLSNLKAHLYRELLKSLRLKSLKTDVEINIREMIDYAKVLYNKGLYSQTLKMLEKAKAQAKQYNRDILQLEIIEFEKLIELQYITRSLENRAEELSNESIEIAKRISNAGRYSNLALRLYGLYIKVGSVRDKKDLLMVSRFFSSQAQFETDITHCSFHEKLYMYQSYVWFNYIIQDFVACYKYAQKWVDLFDEHPEIRYIQTDLYLKGLHNLLGSLHMVGHRSYFTRVLSKLKELIHDDRIDFNDNNLMLYHLFTYMNTINKHFLDGTFTKGVGLIPEIDRFIDQYSRHLDNHRILVFYYKIACLYFGSGDYKTSISYLNHVLNTKDISLREDIHCFSRILNLIAHYELGNEELIEFQVISTYRFLSKMNDLNMVQKYVLEFLRHLSYIQPNQLEKEFKKLHAQLVSLENNPFERRVFLYLDLISWLESKIQKRPVEEIIQEKNKD